jgi:predicted transcriptional regulator
MPLSQTAPARVQSATNQVRALELRIQGLTLQQIADQISVSKARVYQYVSEGLAELNEICAVQAEQLRRLTSEQIDTVLAAHMPLAIQGDTKSANVCSRLLDQRVRLYGLIASPKETPVSRFENMSPDALREEARRLGLYVDPPVSPDAPYQSVPSANGQTSMGGSCRPF